MSVYVTYSIWQTGARIPPSEDFTIAQLPPMFMLRESSRVRMASEQESCALCIPWAERERVGTGGYSDCCTVPPGGYPTDYNRIKWLVFNGIVSLQAML